MADDMGLIVEQDGTISFRKDGAVSPMNHKSADEFLRIVKELSKGAFVDKKLPHSHGTVKGGVKVGR